MDMEVYSVVTSAECKKQDVLRLKSNPQDTLVKPLSFYADKKFTSILDALEKGLGVDNHFEHKRAMVSRLIDLLANHATKSPCHEKMRTSALTALRSVMDEGVNEVPPFTYSCEKNPVRGIISNYPTVALLFEQTRNHDSSTLDRLRCLFLYAILAFPETLSTQLITKFRLYIGDPCASATLLTYFANIEYSSPAFSSAIEKAKFLNEKKSDNRKAFQFIKAVTEIFEIQLLILSSENVQAARRSPSNQHRMHSGQYQSKHWIKKLQALSPGDTRRLLSNERALLVRHLIEALDSHVDSQRNAAGIIMLSYLTGKTYQEVYQLSVGKDITPDGTYVREIIHPSGFSQYNREAYNQSNIARFIDLPLPKNIGTWISKSKVCDTILVDQLFPSKEKATEAIKRFFKILRRNFAGQRLRMEKIPAALAIEVQLLYRDESLTYAIAARRDQAPPAMSFYNAISVTKIQESYQRAAERLLVCSLINTSKLSYSTPKTRDHDQLLLPHPSYEDVQNLRKNILEVLNGAKESKNIVETHNAFTDYCLALLFFATGHRPVGDPFGTLNQIDISTGKIAISDKVTSRSTTWRVVALCEIACKQIEFYLSYLDALPSKLIEEEGFESMSHKLDLAIREKRNRAFPLFFYLDQNNKNIALSITQKSLKERFERYWHWPNNFLRHVLATELSRYLNCGELVKIQLGHIYSERHPFGVRATISCQSVCDILSPTINSILIAHSWLALKSPIRKTRVMPTPKNPVRIRDRKMGFERREDARRRVTSAAKYIINEQLKVLLNRRNLKQLTIDELEQFKGKIESLHFNRRILGACRSLINDTLEFKLAQRNKFPQQRAENSPFHAKTLSEYQQSFQLRVRFIEYLNTQNQSQPITISGRIAEILISAALMGGLTHNLHLRALLSISRNSANLIGDKVMIDFSNFSDEPANKYVWQPDNVTVALIFGLLKIDKFNKLTNSAKKNEKALRCLLQKLEINTDDPIAFLTKAADQLTLIEFPGMLRAHARREITTVSPPIKTLVRVHENGKLEEPNQVEKSKKRIEIYSLPSPKSGNCCGKNTQDFRRFLSKRLMQIVNLPYEGNENRNGKLKRELKTKLLSEFSLDRGWGAHIQLLVGFAIHMIEFGTLQTKDPAFNTVKDYLGICIRGLAPLDSNKIQFDLFKQTSAFWEELYVQAVFTASSCCKQKTATVLHLFHNFLCEIYAFENIDWSAVYGSANSLQSAKYIDANIVSESEYLDLLDVILSSEQLSHDQRNQLATLVLLGFRAGFRFHESYGLLCRDVLFDDHLNVFVKRNIIRDLKTPSGKRVLQVSETLHAIEQKIIQNLLSFSSLFRKHDPLSPLFGDPQHSGRSLISRTWATQVIHNLLRELTGDQTLRYHHFRHSYASRQVFARCHPISLGEIIDDSENFNLHFFPLREIATELGHLDELTTLNAYTHSCSALNQRYLTKFEHQLNDKARDYCMALASGTSRKKKYRQRNELSFSSVQNNRRMKTLLASPEVKTASRQLIEPSSSAAVRNDELSLSSISQLLYQYASLPSDKETFAALWGSDPGLTKQIIKVAKRVELESGFTLYRLWEKDQTKAIKIDSLNKNSYFKKANETRFIYALEKFNVRIEDPIFLAEHSKALEVWANSFHQQSEQNIVSTIDEANQLIQLFIEFYHDIKLTLFVSETRYQKQWMSSLPFEVKVGKVPKLPRKIKQANTSSASLKISLLADRRLVHRMAFIASVYAKIYPEIRAYK